MSAPYDEIPAREAIFGPDPGFRPGAGFRDATLARGRHLRRRRLVVRTAVTAAAALVLSAVAVGAAVDRRAGEVDRIDVATIGEPPPLDGPVTLLVAGTDDEGRADTLAVVRLDPGAGSIEVLAIPRDTWVVLGETGRRARINQAAVEGGPDLLVETVERSLGVPVDHLVMVDGDANGDNVIDVNDISFVLFRLGDPCP